jgi:hypothetical protein
MEARPANRSLKPKSLSDIDEPQYILGSLGAAPPGEGGRIILPEAKGKLRAETRLRLTLTFYRNRSILT